MNFWVVIPARYASTRLPGKPLCNIAGKPMLWHVYQHAIASGAARVLIATDDERIRTVAEQFGATVCMTSPQHRSGTDRVAEAIQQCHVSADTIIVNVQGDEPMLPPTLIHQVASALAHQPPANMATLCEPITTREAIFNPNIVKVVFDKQGFALYFSRAPIPWERDEFNINNTVLTTGRHFRHIGIYAYRADYLAKYVKLPPCELEQVEALEQLRILFEGGKIYVAQALESPGIGIDTPEDLEKIRAIYEKS